MAKKNVYPGARCKIIGSAKGPTGTSVGRYCTAIQIRAGVPHTVWGPVWICESADGLPFDIRHEDGTEYKRLVADFAEDWLEVEEDDLEPPKVKEKEINLVD